MKLWNLYYVKEFEDSGYYYIPIDISVKMFRSFNNEGFEIIQGIPSSSPESDWPDDEIIYKGNHAQSAIKILFKYGIKK